LPRDTEAAIVVAVQTVTILCIITVLKEEGGTLEPTAVPSLPHELAAGEQRSIGEGL